MTYSVSGYIDRVAYTANVDDPNADGGAGRLSGSPNVVALLEAHDGEPVAASPVGPFGTVDLGDDSAILIALMALTDVREVDGDAPDLDAGDDPRPVGALS